MRVTKPLALAVAMANLMTVQYASAQVQKNTLNGKDDGQEQASAYGMAVEEIIVTSTRRETALNQTPIAVSAVSQEQLKALNVTDVSNLNLLVPGLQIRDNSSDGQGSVDINMRGVGNSNFIETGESNVSFNIDGVYTARPQAALQLFSDVERVEVNRGPQGTLSGRNATVGSINVITAKPDFDGFATNVELEAGSFDAKGFRGMVNIPLGDALAIRANYANYERASHSELIADEEMNNAGENLTNGGLNDGNPVTAVDAMPVWSTGVFEPFVENRDGGYWQPYYATHYGNGGDEGVGAFGSKDIEAGRISALWQPSNDFKWLLTYERFENKALGNPLSVDCQRANCEDHYTPSQVAVTAPNVAFLSLKGKTHQKITNYRSVLEYNVADMFDVKYTYGHTKFSNTNVQDLDFGVAIELVAMDGGGLTQPWYNKSSVHDLQFTSSGDGALQWTAGLFDFSEKTDRSLFVSYFPFGQVSFPNHNYTVKTQAAYADITYDLTSAAQVFFGARHTKDEKSNRGAYESRLISEACAEEIKANPNNLSENNFAGAGAIAMEQSPACTVGAGAQSPASSDAFTDYRLGMNVNITDDLMVYGSVSTGHKAALQDQIYNLPRYQTSENLQTVSIPVATENLVSYEVGAKGRVFDDRINYAISAFFMDYKDKQEAQFYNFGDSYCDLDGDGLFGGSESVGGNGANPSEGEPGCGLGFDESTNPLGTPDLDDSEFPDNLQYAIVPAAAVEIYGVELEASSKVMDNGYLKGFLTYTDAQYKDFTYSHVLGCPNDALTWCDAHNVSGNRPRSTPEFTANLTYSHTFDIGPLGSLVPTVNAYYRSKYYLTPENVDEGQVHAEDIGVDNVDFEDGTTAFNNNETSLYADVQNSSIKMNVNITWYVPGDSFEVELFGTNITDEKVRSHIRIDTANTPLFSYENPREIGARVRYQF